jgi:hypothetical protein
LNHIELRYKEKVGLVPDVDESHLAQPVRNCSRFGADIAADSETGLTTSFRQFEDWFNEFNG